LQKLILLIGKQILLLREEPCQLTIERKLLHQTNLMNVSLAKTLYLKGLTNTPFNMI
jgi:hypothetical protein